MAEIAQAEVNIPLPPSRKDWPKVQKALHSLAKSSTADCVFDALLRLSNIISSYGKAEKISDSYFGGLKKFYDKFATEEECLVLVEKTLPCIAQLALDIEKFCPPGGLVLSRQQEPCHVELHRMFVASIVASGFLSLFEQCDNQLLPDINFQMFFAGINAKSQQAKLRMILHYFERVASSDGNVPGIMSYTRIVLQKNNLLTIPKLQSSGDPLIPFIVDDDNKIEDAGCRVLQVDFANEYLGGGVLHMGQVQEEIRFSICPELISSMLFMECMAANEAIVLQGFEQFAKYCGYANGLKYGGDYTDPSERNAKGNILTSMVAIDAVPYAFMMGKGKQYSAEHYMRDINKAYAGFLQPYYNVKAGDGDTEETKTTNVATGQSTIDKLDPEKEDSWAFNLDPMSMRTIATGNWGCGAFGGDPQLKAMLQWIAASSCKCPALIYYTFKDKNVWGLKQAIDIIVERKWGVKDLFQKVESFCEAVVQEEEIISFFEYLSKD